MSSHGQESLQVLLALPRLTRRKLGHDSPLLSRVPGVLGGVLRGGGDQLGMLGGILPGLGVAAGPFTRVKRLAGAS